MKKFKSILPLILVSFLMTGITACKKDAGEGGTSTITGKITTYNFNNLQFICCPDTFPAVDQDVFIIYGADKNTYDNDMKTTFDGTYEFKYLQKGKYRIFAYSKDSSGASTFTADPKNRPDVPLFVDVEITGKNQTVVGPEIIILTTKF